MSSCNGAFVFLASKVDEILGATSAIGDINRVGQMANYLLLLLTNSLESLTWANTRDYI